MIWVVQSHLSGSLVQSGCIQLLLPFESPLHFSLGMEDIVDFSFDGQIKSFETILQKKIQISQTKTHPWPWRSPLEIRLSPKTDNQFLNSKWYGVWLNLPTISKSSLPLSSEFPEFNVYMMQLH